MARIISFLHENKVVAVISILIAIASGIYGILSYYKHEAPKPVIPTVVNTTQGKNSPVINGNNVSIHYSDEQ